jgi:hypothetical protein
MMQADAAIEAVHERARCRVASLVVARSRFTTPLRPDEIRNRRPEVVLSKVRHFPVAHAVHCADKKASKRNAVVETLRVQATVPTIDDNSIQFPSGSRIIDIRAVDPSVFGAAASRAPAAWAECPLVYATMTSLVRQAK